MSFPFIPAFTSQMEEEEGTKKTEKGQPLRDVEKQERMLPRNKGKDISRWQGRSSALVIAES